jgi:hypothetical protein
MALTPKEIGPIDWVYDRAALVALPDSMRKEYLTAIDRLTGVGTQSLVISSNTLRRFTRHLSAFRPKKWKIITVQGILSNTQKARF